MCELDYNYVIKGIAERIRSIRKSQKMTVQELAYRCDMERSNMSRIESGKINITIKTLTLIASALGVNLTDLFKEEA